MKSIDCLKLKKCSKCLIQVPQKQMTITLTVHSRKVLTAYHPKDNWTICEWIFPCTVQSWTVNLLTYSMSFCHHWRGVLSTVCCCVTCCVQSLASFQCAEIIWLPDMLIKTLLALSNTQRICHDFLDYIQFTERVMVRYISRTLIYLMKNSLSSPFYN